MGDLDAFERVLASLHEAMLDDSRWAATSALIDEACGLAGNALLTGDGHSADPRVNFVGLYYRGARRTDLEREYLEVYHPIDERVPRLRQLPDSQLVSVQDMYTPEELKTSPTFNEILSRHHYRQGLNVRMDGLDGSDIGWGLADPVTGQDWESPQVALVTRLVPHVRQFVRVRQALVRAGSFGTGPAALLENRRIGVVHLDRRGHVLAANDRARDLLQGADGLSDRDGALQAWAPGDQPGLQRLLAGALPAAGGVAVSGSMALRRADGLLPLVLHVKPVTAAQPDYGGRGVAALVLIVEPGGRFSIDPALVAGVLGLTRAESQVAAWLAEGRSVEDITRLSGRATETIYWRLKQIYQKLHLSRQADLVRLVLSVAGPD